MHFQESENVELKQEYIEDVRKELIAMANSAGGKLYIGVGDDGIPVGVDNPDDIIQRITNGVRDAIKPDLSMFLHYAVMDADGKNIVVVEVQRGTARPYYLAAKGLRPAGVYVRQGTSSVPASDAAIRQMIKDTDGDNYEDMRSLEQSLTFLFAADFFTKRKVEWGIPQMKTLGLLDSDGLFTNLGLLLSDQCPHIIKAATFGGSDQNDFQDRREFTGSLLKQLDDAYAYLDMRNQNSASFEGLYRTDHRNYPESALREALLNALVHRDYSISASTLISVYSDRIEMVSIGGLVHGIALNDVLMGLSVCRNQKLANIFYRLELIEAYGTGMRKIQSAYKSAPHKPEILPTSNAFKVVLPNLRQMNAISGAAAGLSEFSRVLALAQENGTIVRKDVENALGIGSATAIRLLKKMVESEQLVCEGKGRNTHYTPKK